MKKVYHLASCSTCAKIISDTGLRKKGFEFCNIGIEKITPAELDEMKSLAGSYEALFSRRSRQYQVRGLKDQVLTEDDFRRLILEEYTFLKRPVVIRERKIFIGSEKQTVAALQKI